mmetsp:Transcript_14528/g.36878  ORF Transcript_14528/g.36878 Transcript_14528/m.36878 type:complete len:466 (+) Transcript_14528:3681-5078(+)
MAISLVYPIHNQTANVWTHVCGSIIVGAIIWHTFSRKGPMRGSGQASALDIAAEAGFLFGALACLVLSATFHLFCDASLGVRRFCLKLDFAGVLCLVWGSWLPLLQFGLACRHYSWRMAYAGTITGGVIVVAILCLLPRFATPAYQPVRAAVFLFIGWVGAVPAAQLIIDQHTRPIGLGIIYMGLLYSVGTVIDVLRFPERMFFRPAPPSIILIAVGGAKEGGDDGLRGSIHIDLDATVGSPAAVAPGLSDVTEEDGEGAAVHSSAMNSNASSGMNSPKQGQRNTPISPSASFGGIGFLNRSRSGSDAEQRMLDLAPRPNTVTSTILGSGSALDLLRSVSSVESSLAGRERREIEKELETLADESEDETQRANQDLDDAGNLLEEAGASKVGSLPTPHLTATQSMLDRLRAAEKHARAHAGAWAPLLCIWGSHATFHCFVVAAVLTHYNTSMVAWRFKLAHCPSH